MEPELAFNYVPKPDRESYFFYTLRFSVFAMFTHDADIFTWTDSRDGMIIAILKDFALDASSRQSRQSAAETIDWPRGRTAIDFDSYIPHNPFQIRVHVLECSFLLTTEAIESGVAFRANEHSIVPRELGLQGYPAGEGGPAFFEKFVDYKYRHFNLAEWLDNFAMLRRR